MTMGPLEWFLARAGWSGNACAQRVRRFPRVRQSTGSVSAVRLVSALAGWLVVAYCAASVAQMPPAQVLVAEVQQRELAAGYTFVGTVTPLRTSTVGSPVDGRVIELMVREGDAVNKGDALAQLRTRQLEIRLAAAKAELELRMQELAELKESLPAEIEQARARMLIAKATRDFTAARLRRTQTLFARKVTSEDDLQEVRSAAQGAEHKYVEDTSAWKLAVATQEEKIGQARARMVSAEEEVHRLEDEITEHTIEAPFDGYVTAEHTEVGQWIAQGAAVVDVIEIGSVDVEVFVLESYVPRLKVGMTARVTIGALPGQSWTAPVSAIVPQADIRSRSFPVKVRLENRDGPNGPLFKPGMFARVTLPLGEKGLVLLVPKDALVLGGERPTVYAVAPLPNGPAPGGGPSTGKTSPGPLPDGVARMVTVELGTAVDGLIEVRGELSPGERVVVEGNERLFPGQPVSIVDKTASSDSQPKVSRTSKDLKYD